MNFKIIGILLIIFSGILSVYTIKRKYSTRIEFIEEFIKSLEFMCNQIAFYKTPLKNIIESFCNSLENKLNFFYEKVLSEMESESIEISFKNSLEKTEYGLSQRDKQIIGDFAKSLGNTDYESQLNHINATKELFKSELLHAMENKRKNQKAKCTLVMSAFIVIALLLW